MWWRKKKEQPPSKCNHHWQDFPWYVESTYNRDTQLLIVRITKPYVCIHCKKRKDVVLLDRNAIFNTFEEANEWFNDIMEPYNEYTEPRAIVEDKIANMQLVDEEYLKYYRMLNNIKE